MMRFRGVQVRTTIIASAVVAIVLVGAGMLLVSNFRGSVIANLDDTLQLRADDLVNLLAGGAEPDPLLDPVDGDSFAIAFGPGYLPTRPIHFMDPCQSFPCSSLVALIEGSESSQQPLLEDFDQPHLMRQAQAVRDEWRVVVGAELESVDKAVAGLVAALAVGIPLVLSVIGALIWIVVGRVLAPVEAIRTQAASIHGGSLEIRVPESGSGDEIDRLAGTVNEMLNRLSDDAAIRRRFASDASHELKSPLANLRVMIDTAQGEEWTRVSSTAAAEVDRMGTLVDNLLFLAVLDEGASDIGDNRVHLDDLAFDEVEVAAAASDHVIDANGVQPAVILGDADQLRRAVRNVIDNAVRYARREVRVRTSDRNGTVSLVVEDDGPGIPAESRATVFERFGRVDDSRTRRTGSTGLGLAIAHEIVSRHGGSIMVGESDLGGARFIFEFPEA